MDIFSISFLGSLTGSFIGAYIGVITLYIAKRKLGNDEDVVL